MENYAKFVATEILKQLGGNRFIAMTGATKFAYFDENGECGLFFRLPSNFAMKGINLVKPRFYVSTSKSIIKALINMHSFEIQLSPIG
ncbi:hypothetical protein [Escherichia coli]|uniref:hypothetical protein n=1 Tax=Escherichia coli TaxID=562 RepID=UPI0028D9A886|nr:hypothetical protein [Escherichia coli]HEC1000712.1 hypothetical protein [Escherichia coli]